MAKTKTTGLDEIIDRYGKNKEIEKNLKSEISKDNNELKHLLAIYGPEVSTNSYKAKLSTSVSEKFDEDLLLQGIKTYWEDTFGPMPCDFIATKEYVDMDKLENALYNNEIGQELKSIIASCKYKIETERLTIRRV